MGLLSATGGMLFAMVVVVVVGCCIFFERGSKIMLFVRCRFKPFEFE